MAGTIALPSAAAASTTRSRGAGLLPVLCLLFFASGACGLVYQQLWLRQLTLVFGVTVHAVSTVLAAFFGGLALGSFLAGRWSARTRRPLHWYGVVEVIVGILAIATPTGLRLVERVYVAIAGEVGDSVPVLTAIRFVLSFVVLLVPSTMLGATLPLVVSSSAVRRARLGERIGVLYATNTAGAIVGTLAAGFWMIGGLGILGSFRVAATVNVVVGLLAIGASRWFEQQPADDPDPVVEAPAVVSDDLAGRPRRLLLAVFAVSGLASIALEVVWFRVLVQYVSSDTYAFTIMLATVLAGISAGGLLAAIVIRRWGARLSHLVVVEIGVAVAALTSFVFLSKSFTVNGRYGEPLRVFGEDVRFVIVAGALTVAPTAVLLGVAFPIGLGLWTAGSTDPAITSRRVGVFYAVNVAAGIAGSLAAGFFLIPLIGTRPTLILLSATLFVSGLALLEAMPIAALRRRGMCVAGALVFTAVAVVAVPSPYAAALKYRFAGEEVLWRKEGPQTTVSIHQVADGNRVMYLDGHHQANSTDEMVQFHGLIGVLPLALHPDPQRALVIGLGGGVTAASLSSDADLTVDVVELAPEVVDGAKLLTAVDDDVTQRANVSLRIDDGRNYLLTTDEQYDVITADLIPPEHAGAGKLWSVEYWELARDALAPGGMMVQWAPNARALQHSLIVRSFVHVFPYVTAWAGGSLLVGSNEPVTVSAARYLDRVAEPGLGPALTEATIGSVEALRRMYTAGPAQLEAYSGSGPLLTDDRPRLEYWKSGGAARDRPLDPTGLFGDVGEVVLP